jgi:hypothetical protein
MAQPAIVDGRNLLAADQVSDAGFQYFSVGRRSLDLDLRVST